jgi:hypothetical protein
MTPKTKRRKRRPTTALRRGWSMVGGGSEK